MNVTKHKHMQKHKKQMETSKKAIVYLCYECHLLANSEIKIKTGWPLNGLAVYLGLALLSLVILPQVSGHRLNLYYKNLQNLGKWISRPQPYDLSILSLGLRFTNLVPRTNLSL